MKNVRKTVDKILNVCILVLFIAMFGVTTLNVIMRYLFRNPLAWSDELAMISLAYVTFVGGAAAYKKNLHFGIDVLLDLMPVSVRMFIRRIVNFVFIILFGYVTYLGWNLFINAKKVFNYSGWSYKVMDLALPLGFLSMTVYAIYFFIQSFTDKKAYHDRYEKNYEEENVDQDLVEASAAIFADDERGEK